MSRQALVERQRTQALFWGAQAASLQFAAACRENMCNLTSVALNAFGKLPNATGLRFGVSLVLGIWDLAL